MKNLNFLVTYRENFDIENTKIINRKNTVHALSFNHTNLTNKTTRPIEQADLRLLEI
jgi:hypothetical protein